MTEKTTEKATDKYEKRKSTRRKSDRDKDREWRDNLAASICAGLTANRHEAYKHKATRQQVIQESWHMADDMMVEKKRREAADE